RRACIRSSSARLLASSSSSGSRGTATSPGACAAGFDEVSIGLIVLYDRALTQTIKIKRMMMPTTFATTSRNESKLNGISRVRLTGRYIAHLAHGSFANRRVKEDTEKAEQMKTISNSRRPDSAPLPANYPQFFFVFSVLSVTLWLAIRYFPPFSFL